MFPIPKASLHSISTRSCLIHFYPTLTLVQKHDRILNPCTSAIFVPFRTYLIHLNGNTEKNPIPRSCSWSQMYLNRTPVIHQKNSNWMRKKKFSTKSIDLNSNETLSNLDKSNIELQMKIVRHIYPKSCWPNKDLKDSLMSHLLKENLLNINYIRYKNYLGISKEKIARRVFFLYKQNPSIYQHLSVEKLEKMIKSIKEGQYNISPCEIKEYDSYKYQRSFNIIKIKDPKINFQLIPKFEGSQFVFHYSACDILLQDALFSLIQEGILYVFDIPAHMHSAEYPLLDRESLQIFGNNLHQNKEKFASNVIPKLRLYDDISQGLIINLSSFLRDTMLFDKLLPYNQYLEEHYYHPLKLFLDIYISDSYIIELLLSFIKNDLFFDNQLLESYQLSMRSSVEVEASTFVIDLLFREHYLESFPLLLLLQNLRFYIIDIDILSLFNDNYNLYTRFNSEFLILFEPSLSVNKIEKKISRIFNIIHNMYPYTNLKDKFHFLKRIKDKSASSPFLGKQVYLNQTGDLTLSTETDAKKDNSIKDAIKNAKKTQRKKK